MLFNVRDVEIEPGCGNEPAVKIEPYFLKI